MKNHSAMTYLRDHHLTYHFSKLAEESEKSQQKQAKTIAIQNVRLPSIGKAM